MAGCRQLSFAGRHGPQPHGRRLHSGQRQRPVQPRLPAREPIQSRCHRPCLGRACGISVGAVALSSLGEEVYLFSGDGTNLTGYRHGFEFGAQLSGVTFGRYVTSDGLEHSVAQEHATLAAANAGPEVGPVVINEIMYAPPPFGLDADNLDEYVELRNFSSQAVPLFDPAHVTNTWRLDGGIQFTFPLGFTMAPSSYLLVVNFDPDHDSLQRIASIAFADDPANWQAAAPTAGSLNQGAWTADTDHDGFPDEWELSNGLDPKDPTGANGPLGDPYGDGMNNLAEYFAGTNPTNALSCLRLQIQAAGNPLSLSFEAVANHSYTVQFVDALGSSDWQKLANVAARTTNHLESLADSLSVTNRYYRLIIPQQP
ncbi:MAG: hypothetical protein NT154_22825 [Verrucomicrobia bacterium]|nr:hypothetical protein [Verrucomicrobiota bacterium]